MVFFKNIFNGAPSNGTSPTLVPVKVSGGLRLNSSTNGKGRSAPKSQLFFSRERDFDPYELEKLCRAVGWSRRPLRKVKKAIEHSFLVITMWEQRENYRSLIGFSRATSDHAFNATIWDVVIHPEFQGRGLGKALMQQLVKELRRADISNITLFADAHVVDFYRELGFKPDPEGIKGMFWYPHSR